MNAMPERKIGNTTAIVACDETMLELCMQNISFKLYVGGREVALSRAEFVILLDLARRKGQWLSPAWLGDIVYGMLFDGDPAQRLTRDIDRLREALKAAVGRDVIQHDRRGYALSTGVDVRVRML